MKWFKHYSNTTMVEPVCRVHQDMGFSGLGVLWLLVERIVFLDGAIRLSEACSIVVSKHFTRKKLISLITGYDIFILDEKQGTISLDPTFIRLIETDASTQKGPSKVPAKSEQGPSKVPAKSEQSPSKVPASPSLAPASCSTNPVEEENKKEEEEEERTLSKSPSGGAEEETVVDPLARFAAQPWHDLAQQMATAEAHRAWRQQVEMSLGWPDLRLPRAWPEAIALVCGMAVEGGSEGRLMCESHFKGYFTFLCRHGTFAPRLRSELTARMLALRRGSMPDDERSFYDYMKQRYPHLTQWQEPLTFEQYRQLRSQYPISLIASLLDKLNNRPLREQRISVGETMREWIAKVKG